MCGSSVTGLDIICIAHRFSVCDGDRTTSQPAASAILQSFRVRPIIPVDFLPSRHRKYVPVRNNRFRCAYIHVCVSASHIAFTVSITLKSFTRIWARASARVFPGPRRASSAAAAATAAGVDGRVCDVGNTGGPSGKPDTQVCRSLFVPRITVFTSVFVLHSGQRGRNGAPTHTHRTMVRARVRTQIVHARYHTQHIDSGQSRPSASDGLTADVWPIYRPMHINFAAIAMFV